MTASFLGLWRALLAMFPALLLAGCAGLFQRPLPDVPDSYAHVSAGSVQAGFAEADITPSGDQYLAGFTINKPSSGVLTRLKARAAVLVVGGCKIAIVGLDNLGLMREDVEWIKRSLTGFRNGEVFLCSSHTHAAPDLIGLWGFYFLTSGRDAEYLDLVRRGVRDAVLEAEKNLRPAKLVIGGDRMPAEGLVGNSRRKGVFNRRVTVLHATAEDGTALGTVLHLACHPEMMRRDNTLISADMAGALCDAWRQAGHGQGVFVNGELGAMITPRFKPRGAEGMPLVGRSMVPMFEAALRDAKPIQGRINVRRQDVYMPLRTPGLVVGRLTGAIRRELYDGHLRTSVGYLEIGAFEAVCVPGEMEPVLADEIRRALRKPNLVFFGLVDDEIGYLLRGVDAVDPRFGYERTMSPCRDAGERVRRAIVGR